MMDYNLFKEVVTDRICDFLPPIFNDYKPVVETVNKVNQKKDALTMHADSADKSVSSPVIYLDEMYKSFIECEDMDLLLQRAANVIIGFTGVCQKEKVDIDFKKMKNQIVPNLIGRQFNEELLKNVPYKEVLDMAVIYRIMMPADDGGFHSLVINNSIFQQLEIDMEQMHDMAIENMKNVLPLEYNKISKDRSQIQLSPQIPDSIIFVYSHQNIYGSAYMLNEYVMHEFSKALETNRLFIVPASINYFAVCAAEERYLDFLVNHLSDLNQDELEINSILSKCIYSYDVETKALAVEASYEPIHLDAISLSLQ